MVISRFVALTLACSFLIKLEPFVSSPLLSTRGRDRGASEGSAAATEPEKWMKMNRHILFSTDTLPPCGGAVSCSSFCFDAAAQFVFSFTPQVAKRHMIHLDNHCCSINANKGVTRMLTTRLYTCAPMMHSGKHKNATLAIFQHFMIFSSGIYLFISSG